MRLGTRKLVGLALGAAILMAAGVAAEGIPHRRVADMLHLVVSSDRAVYTRKVVQRLTRDKKIITASEHFEDDSALPLPAQMFRFGAELVTDKTEDFSYSLLSLHPINKKNGPGTNMERKGLEYVENNPGKNYYGEEKLGGRRYFTAVYPDYAVAEACVNCHNSHKDSPRADATVGDVMGGVVIRIPLDLCRRVSPVVRRCNPYEKR